MSPADLDGTLPPLQGEPGFALGFTDSALLLYRYQVDWQHLENTGVELIRLPVAPFTPACSKQRSGVCIPQPPAAPPLDSLADRIMFRVAYRNMGSYDVLVANHTVATESGAGIRWYEVRDPGGDPVVYQQGTYAPDSASRWLGSIAVDGAGDIGLGFSISSSAQRPGIAYTGRVASDAPGVMGQGEAVFTGGGSQVGSLRWGDYSSLSVDPADDCTFWYTGEYIPADGVFNWRTRVMTFQLPGCTTAPDFAVWIAPPLRTLGAGMSATFAVMSAALRPSAAARTLSLSLDGLPAGLEASLDAATLSPGKTALLTVRAAAGAQLGEVPLVVHAAEAAGASRSASATATVVANDFTLEVQPSASISAGVSTEVRINTRPLFGQPELLSFSAAHAPRGVTAVFDPPVVIAGEPVTLTLASDPELSAGATNLRITAVATSESHSATVRVRALVAPQVSISWPLTQQNLRGKSSIIAIGAAGAGATIASISLYIDDKKHGESNRSPAVFLWDTGSVNDGVHHLEVRAIDTQGSLGRSDVLEVWVVNGSGCSTGGAGWMTAALAALLFALRRSVRKPA
jgi:hypothetical protein